MAERDGSDRAKPIGDAELAPHIVLMFEQAEEQLPAGVIGVVVRHEGDRRVQDDPEQHGDAPERIKVVSAIGRVAQIDGLGVG